MFASGLNKTLDARQTSPHTTAVDPTNTQEQRAVTRKDYVLIAAALAEARNYSISRSAHPESYFHGCDAVAYEIANSLGKDNPRFDRARFLKAAGVAP